MPSFRGGENLRGRHKSADNLQAEGVERRSGVEKYVLCVWHGFAMRRGAIAVYCRDCLIYALCSSVVSLHCVLTT